MRKRDPFFDVVKAFAMMLVVVGHTRWAYGCQAGNPAIDNFIIGMNMPLFFMISGYFSARTIMEGDWKNFARHLVEYFWPMAVVSCGFAVIAMLFGIEGSDKGLVGYAGRCFLFSFWFLWCLAICYVLTFLSCRFRKVSPFIVLAVVYFILPFLTVVWHISNVIAMFPHFIIGLFILRRWPIWKKCRIGSVCLCGYLLIVVFSASFRQNGLSFYNGKTNWVDLVSEPVNILLLFSRILIGIVGSIGIMWLINETVKRIASMGGGGYAIWHNYLGCLSPSSVDTGALCRLFANGRVIWCNICFCDSIVHLLPLSSHLVKINHIAKKNHLGPLVGELSYAK